MSDFIHELKHDHRLLPQTCVVEDVHREFSEAAEATQLFSLASARVEVEHAF